MKAPQARKSVALGVSPGFLTFLVKISPGSGERSYDATSPASQPRRLRSSASEPNARSDPGRDLIAKKTGQVLPCPVLTFKNQRPL